MDIEIKAPEGYKLVESIKDNVKHISFVPEEKEKPKTAMDSWEEVVMNYLKGKICFSYDTEIGGILSGKLHDPDMNNVFDAHLTKERAEAFLYLQALVTARDYYNEGWVADWEDNCATKYTISSCKNKIGKDFCYHGKYTLNFKTPEIRNKFYEDFKEWIELCKDLI